MYHEPLYKRDSRGSKAEKDVRTEAKVGVMSCEDGNQGMQAVLEAGKGKELDSPLEPSEARQPYQPTSDF